MRKIPAYQKTALFLGVLILCAAIFCIGWIAVRVYGSRMRADRTAAFLTADIYQNGSLLASIPLDSEAEPYSFTVTGENGSYNEIQVLGDSIGIISASCPDKLCIRQGFRNNSLLPITCLPNHLVIQVREEPDETTADVITYQW